MTIVIIDDEGTVTNFTVTDLLVMHEVLSALQATESVSYSAGHHSDTGACLCQSFSQTFVGGGSGQFPSDWQCYECKHEAHNSRAFCGALK